MESNYKKLFPGNLNSYPEYIISDDYNTPTIGNNIKVSTRKNKTQIPEAAKKIKIYLL